MWLCNTNAPDNGQDNKDTYFDTSRKILSQEITTCNMEALIFIIRSYDQCQFHQILVECQFEGQKVKYQKIDLITRNIHVKYQSSIQMLLKALTVPKILARLKFSKNRSYHMEYLWNIKALALIVQMLLVGLIFFKKGQSPRLRLIIATLKKFLPLGILMWNIKALALTVQKLLVRLKFQTELQNDRKDKNNNPPLFFDLEGMEI